ncbi:MAG: DMT family transporter [Luteibaculaceae bacterium]
MQNYTKSLLLLHFVVLIFGFTAILGELISLGSTQLVWIRMGLAFLSMLGWLLIKNKISQVFNKASLVFLLVGFIIAVHWITFFQAIKVANVSVALVAISTASLFTAILEPLFFKRKFRPSEVVLGLFVVLGISLIFNFESQYRLGLFFGLVSAFLASLFTVINGTLVKRNDSAVLSTVEMLGGFLGISVLLAFTGKLNVSLLFISSSDWIYLLILAIVCTAFAFIASVYVMRELTPFTVSITINLEPLYGIFLALIFFGEQEKMTPSFYAGMVLILSGVFINAYLKRRARLAEKAKIAATGL